MSKYIKLEDAIHNINLEVIGRKEYTGDMKANLFFALDDLPTIEVSEDERSRAMISIIIDYIPADQCKNDDAWFTCLKCGKCGRKFEDGFLVDDGGTTVTEEVDTNCSEKPNN